MIKIALSTTSVIKNSAITASIYFAEGDAYNQIEISVFSVAVLNPEQRYGISTTPQRTSQYSYDLNLESKHLDYGTYEIKTIRFHNADENLTTQRHFLAERDFSRTFFEVIPAFKLRRTNEEIQSETLQKEAQLRQDFLTPIDIRNNPQDSYNQYSVFVFIENLLIGSHMRFKHFEILPTKDGLDKTTHAAFINHFFNKNAVGLNFPYEEDKKIHDKNSNPVCVTHFPSIVASNHKEARNYCASESERLLLALSLMRGAGGKIFSIVVWNPHNGQSIRYDTNDLYPGNMLTGSLSGENADVAERYISSLTKNPFVTFLTQLHKEAQNEKNPNFKYLRYWQILETLAENRNYNTKKPIYMVCELFKEFGLGNELENSKKINVWKAFRDATAHFGAIDQYEKLTDKDKKIRARVGYAELTSGQYDYLWHLKEDVKLILMGVLREATRP